MGKVHNYKLNIQWTGNKGEGTSAYKAYERSHTIIADNKPDILGSSDPAFRGDRTKHNPEDLLVASLSACHLLSYLHVCADAGIVVVEYTDHAEGSMVETENGGAHFTEVTLHPLVTVKESWMMDKANELHDKASEHCFIASSVNFPVHHKPICKAVNA